MLIVVPLVEVEHERVVNIVEQAVAPIESRRREVLQLFADVPERDIREPERDRFLGLVAVAHLVAPRVPAEHLVEPPDMAELCPQVLLVMRYLLDAALPGEHL